MHQAKGIIGPPRSTTSLPGQFPMSFKLLNPKSAIALLAALAILVAGWVLPLPRLVLGQEEEAATRMPQTVAGVAQARSDFDQAQASYKGYIATHDVGAALDTLEQNIEAAQADPADQTLRNAVGASSQPVRAYLSQLQTYATTGDAYFDQLKYFDDELMAWTRSLGADSESLRADTWPIVEYLKLYPPPTGLDTDYTSMSASDVTAISGHLRAFGPTTDLSTYKQVIADTRAAGRSIEHIESLHAQYESHLQTYLTRLQAVASGTATSLSSGRATFAFGANILIALALLAGLAALFLPRIRSANEATP